MTRLGLDDTIAAISTPIGEGGIGIVRLSGRDSLKIADRIFVSRNGNKPSRFKSYTVHYGHIVEQRPRTTRVRGKPKGKGQRVVDEVILTVMRAPKSYTKEDIVEINCHSGIAPLKKILDLVLVNGARLAEPGEFTKRAFLNGRIDIVQAESVLAIIKAKTDLSLKAALNSLEGVFSKKINEIRDILIGILAHIEATIDFSEEGDTDKLKRNGIFNRIRHVKRDIEKMILKSAEGKILRQGIKAVICGSPNVGKSSLMNALLKESRAIVTHLPGTTRDTIEEIVNIKGIPLVLIDTAGISRTKHPIEKESVKRSHLSIQNSDLILFVLDYSRKINSSDREILRLVKDRDNVIIVVNKKDLTKGINIRVAKRFLTDKPLIYVSAIKLSGIDELEDTIKDVIFKGKAPAADFVAMSNERQLDILRRSLGDINEAIEADRLKAPVDCISSYIKSSVERLGEITGHTVTEETLDRIFSEFCIGK